MMLHNKTLVLIITVVILFSSFIKVISAEDGGGDLPPSVSCWDHQYNPETKESTVKFTLRNSGTWFPRPGLITHSSGITETISSDVWEVVEGEAFDLRATLVLTSTVRSVEFAFEYGYVWVHYFSLQGFCDGWMTWDPNDVTQAYGFYRDPEWEPPPTLHFLYLPQLSN